MLTKAKPSRKAEIERKATVLFKEKGYGASSMRDLASVIGIEAASIYSHIRSKEEILQNICFRLATKFLQGLDEVDSNQWPPERKLREAMIAHVNVITDDLSASAVFWNEWKHLSDPYLSDFLQMKIDYEKRFVKIIAQGIAQGKFESVDAKMAGQLLLSSLNGIHHWYRQPSNNGKVNFANRTVDLLINGIIKKKSN